MRKIMTFVIIFNLCILNIAFATSKSCKSAKMPKRKTQIERLDKKAQRLDYLKQHRQK